METITKVAWAPIKDGKLLCVRTRGLTSFYNVGGKPEPGESDIDALIREVKEEVGVDLVRSSIKLAWSDKAPGVDKSAGKEVILKLFSADYEGELSPSSEIEEMRWLGVADRHLLPTLGKRAMDWLYANGIVRL